MGDFFVAIIKAYNLNILLIYIKYLLNYYLSQPCFFEKYEFKFMP